MALYAIADLHLPLGVDKPMDVFGKRWENYVSRLFENWQSTVKEEDTVVLAGDFSWATYLSESEKDFEFLNSLNGKKIMLKGNHDYWWGTLNKLKEFVKEKGYDNIEFLQNNSFSYNGYSICGSRGWITPQGVLTGEDKKIYEREVIRLGLSAQTAEFPDNIIMFTHFPPLLKDYRENEITSLFEKLGVKKAIFGHIHSVSGVKNVFEGIQNDVEYKLISADYLDFCPYKLCD